MLTPDRKIAIHFDDQLGRLNGKMGHGALRYLPNPVACVIDARQHGRRLREVIDFGMDCPVVRSIDEAVAHGAEVLILGMAPSGGRVPPALLADIDEAVARGLSIVNGLHELLAPRYPGLPPSQWIWDIRREPRDLPIANALAARLDNVRVLTVGTDMAIGKMTVALEIVAEARARGIRAAFLATGQIGILVGGSGIPVDSIRVDYACGAVERMVVEAGDEDLVVIEGQGSVIHPGSTSTLPLIRGSCPTHLVMCHRAGMTRLSTNERIAVPPLRELATLYEDLAAACGSFPRPRTAAIAVNTHGLSDAAARRELAAIERDSGIHTTDVVRYGAGSVLDSVWSSPGFSFKR
jgi:uncharacterized NAD-dependent epimerase/dehydratase family protein